MNYSLGNMLSRGGALNPDGLSLDLAFATDKTLTARKGPTPTFTRASTATFVGSDGLIQSAAINSPRFDHDPVTLACKGLLIEESRTNLCLRSEEFNNAIWQGAVQTPTISTDFAVSPNGTQTAERLQWTVVNGRLQQIFSPSVLTNYTFSVWLKSNTGSNQIVELFLYFGSGGTNYGETKTVTPNWQRFTVTASSTVVAAGAIFQIRSAQSTTDILAWGAQLETGSFHTSYIPTTTTALTRSADVCSITGGDFTGFWNQSAGTLVQVFEASPNTNTTYVSASNGNIAANSVHIDNDTGLMRSVYYSGSSIVATLNLGAVGTVGSVNKVATAYSVNDFAASRNGGSAVTDTSGALPIGLSQMNIGTDERPQVPTSFFSNKCISSLRYYNKRLPNAKLQSITT